MGDVDASEVGIACSVEIRVEADRAHVAPVVADDGGATSLERRLLGAALRELLARGVTCIEPEPPVSDALRAELDALGFDQVEPFGTWEAGGVG